jgi:hypothetical protein
VPAEDGAMIRWALDFAVEQVNSDTALLGQHVLDLRVFDTAGTNSVAMQQGLANIRNVRSGPRRSLRTNVHTRITTRALSLVLSS